MILEEFGTKPENKKYVDTDVTGGWGSGVNYGITTYLVQIFTSEHCNFLIG